MNSSGAEMRPRPDHHQGSRVIRLDELGSMIRHRRRVEQLTLEAVAQQTGVSPATLSRLERRASANDMPTPDVRTLSAIADWLGVVVAGAGSAPVEISGDTPLPKVVEAHLRADRNLDADTAALLARMFRAAYAQATENGRDGSDQTGDESAIDEFGEENK